MAKKNVAGKADKTTAEQAKAIKAQAKEEAAAKREEAKQAKANAAKAKEEVKANKAREREEAKQIKADEKARLARERADARAARAAEGGGANSVIDRAKYADRFQKADVKTASGKRHCIDIGDDIAAALRGKSVDELRAVADQNDLDFNRWAHLNAGMQRMNLANRLRGLARNGVAKIDDNEITFVEESAEEEAA